jgi:recombination protein RecA
MIPTGSAALDEALGIGGLPKGRLVEIAGPKGSGKTTLALRIIAAQKEGFTAFVDADHTLDLRYARMLGVDCSRMLLSQPDCGEQAMDVVEALVRSGQVSVVVVDSVSALALEDGQSQARLMSRAMRRLASMAEQTGTTVVFLNGPDADLAGNALKFYASVRILLRAEDLLVIKNKFAPPFRSCVYL